MITLNKLKKTITTTLNSNSLINRTVLIIVCICAIYIRNDFYGDRDAKGIFEYTFKDLNNISSKDFIIILVRIIHILNKNRSIHENLLTQIPNNINDDFIKNFFLLILNLTEDKIIELIYFIENSSYQNNPSMIEDENYEFNFHYNLINRLVINILNLQSDDKFLYLRCKNKQDLSLLLPKNIKTLIIYLNKDFDKIIQDFFFGKYFNYEAKIVSSENKDTLLTQKNDKIYMYLDINNDYLDNLKLFDDLLNTTNKTSILVVPEEILKNSSFEFYRKSFIKKGLSAVIETPNNSKIKQSNYILIFNLNKYDGIYFSKINFDKRSLKSYEKWINENISKIATSILNLDLKNGSIINQSNLFGKTNLSSKIYFTSIIPATYASENEIKKEIDNYINQLKELVKTL